MTAADMVENLYDVAESVGGPRLDLYDEAPGMMYVEFGYLEGPIIRDGLTRQYPNAQSRYLTNLHEVGHFAEGHTQGRPRDNYENKIEYGFAPETWDNYQWYFDNGVLNSEAEAWDFALNNCGLKDDEILPATRNFMWYTCLNSYYSNALAVGLTTLGQTLGNGDRAHVSFAYGIPKIRPLFFLVKARILEGKPTDEG